MPRLTDEEIAALSRQHEARLADRFPEEIAQRMGQLAALPWNRIESLQDQLNDLLDATRTLERYPERDWTFSEARKELLPPVMQALPDLTAALRVLVAEAPSIVHCEYPITGEHPSDIDAANRQRADFNSDLAAFDRLSNAVRAASNRPLPVTSNNSVQEERFRMKYGAALEMAKVWTNTTGKPFPFNRRQRNGRFNSNAVEFFATGMRELFPDLTDSMILTLARYANARLKEGA